MTERAGAAATALHGLPAIWLRGNCPCADCVDPGSGQRLVGVADLPADAVVASVTTSGDVVEVIFAPDGHRAAFDPAWLAKYASPGNDSTSNRADDHWAANHWAANHWADDRVEDTKRLWTAGAFGDGFPEGSWSRYQDDPAHRRSCVAAMLREGFVRLRGVPCGREQC